MQRMDRRQFLQRMAWVSMATAAGGWLAGCQPQPMPELYRVATATPTEAAPEPTATSAPATATSESTQPPAATAAATSVPTRLVVAHGASPAEITRRAIAALGGMERFVKPGYNVIVKPNICNSYHGPEFASTTNPEVVATIVTLCRQAGAKRVRVMDSPFGGTAEEAYVVSGIGAAVQAAGGEMELMANLQYVETPIPQGRKLKKWWFYDQVLAADAIINVPIPKTHSATGLTMGMKNLMGVTMYRNGLHASRLGQCIADLNSLVRCQLTVVDAVRILMANGPTGGDLNDVKQMDTVIATTDVVAADAYTATLFGQTGADLDYVTFGAEMGLGEIDLSKVRVEELT